MYFKTFAVLETKKALSKNLRPSKKSLEKKIPQEIRKLEHFFRFANRILIFAVFFRDLRCRSDPGCKMNQSGHSMWRGLSLTQFELDQFIVKRSLGENTETCYLPVVNHLSRS